MTSNTTTLMMSYTTRANQRISNQRKVCKTFSLCSARSPMDMQTNTTGHLNPNHLLQRGLTSLNRLTFTINRPLRHSKAYNNTDLTPNKCRLIQQVTQISTDKPSFLAVQVERKSVFRTFLC